MPYIIRNITGKNPINRFKECSVMLDIPVGHFNDLKSIELLPGDQLIIETENLPQSVKKAHIEGNIVTEYITVLKLNTIKNNIQNDGVKETTPDTIEGVKEIQTIDTHNVVVTENINAVTNEGVSEGVSEGVNEIESIEKSVKIKPNKKKVIVTEESSEPKENNIE
jgi:hypothetical protein